MRRTSDSDSTNAGDMPKNRANVEIADLYPAKYNNLRLSSSPITSDVSAAAWYVASNALAMSRLNHTSALITPPFFTRSHT